MGNSQAITTVWIEPSLYVIPGIIHILPLSGVLGRSKLKALYGLNFDDPNLVILMRHRAVLLGLLGSLLVVAAFQPELRELANNAGLISAGSFLLFAKAEEGYNSCIHSVVVVDVVATVSLLGAFALRYFS